MFCEFKTLPEINLFLKAVCPLYQKVVGLSVPISYHLGKIFMFYK